MNSSALNLSKEDSLAKKFATCKVDTQKFAIADKLFSIHIRKGNYDIAKTYSDTLLSLSARLSDQKYLCMAYCYRASYFYKTGKFDSAIVYNNKSIGLAQTIQHYFCLIKSNINLGNIYNQKADYKKSIIYFQNAERYADISKDTLGKISTTLNLGTVFYNINDYVLAKKNFLKVIQVAKSMGHPKSELASAYNNLATVFLNETPKQLDSAMLYYHKFLEESTKLGNNSSVALAYYNIAEVLRSKKETKQAQEYYIKAQDLFGTMEDTFNLTKVLLGMADNYILQNKNNEAISILKQGLAYCSDNDMQSYEADFLKSLSIAYYKIGNYKEAYDVYRIGTTISDSLYNVENSEILYDLQTKYETNEKEKQNILLTSQNVISLKTIKQQRATTFFIIVGLILAIITSFFILRSLRQQKRANKIISEQKMEVEKQKHIVDEKQKEILDSINYAKRIQDALLLNDVLMQENLSDHFVLFKPKDIVSGDFYWSCRKRDLFYIACCDSTGHGVPGAFMSLLNTSFLDEAINEKNINEPSKVLDYVRKKLILSISKDGQKDGFDGILLCINQTTGQISYAAGNNSPVQISNKNFIELPGDRMPVGAGESDEPFKLYDIIIEKGEMLFLYTDGYADQFGGEKGKKFKYKPLNELLLHNSSLPLNEQLKILDQTFENWRGDLEQVDDVCVIGIKL